MSYYDLNLNYFASDKKQTKKSIVENVSQFITDLWIIREGQLRESFHIFKERQF